MKRERTGITPALAVSAVVHVAALLAVIFLGGLFKKPLELGGGVPVTLVAEGPPILRDAPEAPEESLAQTETPAPLPPEPEPAPPAPAPTPTPPTPTPTPAKKPPPAPAPSKKPPSRELDLDRLLSDVQASSSRRPPKPPGGRQGPAKPDTTVKAGTSKGDISQASRGYLNNLGADLGRRWNPNCDVEGGNRVNLTLTIMLNSNGRLIGPPQITAGAKDDPLTKAAMTRAIFAARAAEPFKDFPPELAGEKLNFKLNAQTACSQ